MIKYAYLNDKRNLMLQFADGYIKVISTASIKITPGLQTLYTGIGISIPSGIMPLCISVYSGIPDILPISFPLRSKSEIEIVTYSTNMDSIIVPEKTIVAHIYLLMPSYVNEIDSKLISKELWEVI